MESFIFLTVSIYIYRLSSKYIQRNSFVVEFGNAASKVSQVDHMVPLNESDD